jgi:triphosphatase
LTGVGRGCYYGAPLRAPLAEVIAGSMQSKAVDHKEIEWQFDAPDLERVEGWLEEHPSTSGLSVVPGVTRELTDTYYDTEDWRFYRAGYALRIRRDGEDVEATMKALAPAEGALRQRREISVPLKADANTLKEATGPVGERLRRLAGNRDLHPLFEARTRRRTFVLHPVGSTGKHAVGEVALDETEIPSDGQARLSRVEVEVSPDAEQDHSVGEFVDRLRDTLGLRPTEASKFEVGLAAAGLSPPVAQDLEPSERNRRSDEKDGR